MDRDAWYSVIFTSKSRKVRFGVCKNSDRGPGGMYLCTPSEVGAKQGHMLKKL